MSDGVYLLGGIFALFMLVAVISLICSREAQKRRPNVRVPRETLWARTHRYHGEPK